MWIKCKNDIYINSKYISTFKIHEQQNVITSLNLYYSTYDIVAIIDNRENIIHIDKYQQVIDQTHDAFFVELQVKAERFIEHQKSGEIPYDFYNKHLKDEDPVIKLVNYLKSISETNFKLTQEKLQTIIQEIENENSNNL